MNQTYVLKVLAGEIIRDKSSDISEFETYLQIDNEDKRKMDVKELMEFLTEYEGFYFELKIHE